MEINTYYGRCVCCFSYGYLKTMWEEHYWEGENEIYVEMLIQCFALSWKQSKDSMKRDKICEECIRRLRDANNFKKTVLYSQTQLHHIDEDPESPVKIEQIDVAEYSYGSDSESIANSSLYIDVPDNIRYGDLEENSYSDQDETKKMEYVEIEYLEDEDNKDFLGSQQSLETESSPILSKPKTSKRVSTRWSYTAEDLHACIEAMDNNELTLKEASKKYNIPKSTITAKRRSNGFRREQTAKRKEIAPKFQERLTADSGSDDNTADTNLYMDISVNSECGDSIDPDENQEIEYLEDEDSKEFLESQQMAAIKQSNAKEKTSKRVFKRWRYAPEDLLACVEAMDNNELTLKEASQKYNIPKSTITAKRRSNGFRREHQTSQVKRTKSPTSNIKSPKRKVLKYERNIYMKYSDEDLDACLRALKNKEIALKEASKKYNIPLSTITAMRRVHSNSEHIQKSEEHSQNGRRKRVIKKRRGYEFKVKANVRNILKYSNATPLKGYWGIGYACAYCSYQNSSAAALKLHTLKRHNGVLDAFNVTISFLDMMIKLDITGLECKICRDNFNILDEFMEHLKYIHDKEIHLDVKVKNIIPFKFDTDNLSCALCEKPFDHFKFLTEHMTEHFRNFECDICGRGFVYEKGLSVHRPRHVTGNFKCSYCDKVFSTRLNMKAHERVLHMRSSRTRKCRYCPEKFMDIVQQTKHEVSVHGAKAPSYECKACNKQFFSTLALKSHSKRFHLMLRPHICTICGKGFYYKYDLKKHAVKHTGAKNYQCDICHKWYSSRGSITSHMRIHLDDRRYKCDICEQAFVQKCSLTVHLRKKHGIND